MREGARIKTARRLRKEMTQPEVWLWLRIRGQNEGGVVFRRQHAVGPYILDFYCVKARLAVEVDGEIHTRGKQAEKDVARDVWLSAQGIQVKRINASEMMREPDEAALGVLALARDMIEGK